MTPDLKHCIASIVEGRRLTRDEARAGMGIIMDGNATEAQIGGFLTALRLAGDHPDELLGFLDAFRERARLIHLDDPDAVDLCGTGGDGLGTFNVSTVAAFVVAGAGVTVAKHGNRSVSSRSGSADVLSELGVNIDATPDRMEQCINSIGVGFLFAPVYHPAMRFAAKPRSDLGIRTCFNILGPLANPAGVRRQVIGAFHPAAADVIATLLREIRPAAAMVVTADDGLDEVSPGAPTLIREIREKESEKRYTIGPGTFGLTGNTDLSSVGGGTPADNAAIARSILTGTPGIARDFVLMNSALGLMVAREGLTHPDAFNLCAESIDSGRAFGALRRLVEYTNR